MISGNRIPSVFLVLCVVAFPMIFIVFLAQPVFYTLSDYMNVGSGANSAMAVVTNVDKNRDFVTLAYTVDGVKYECNIERGFKVYKENSHYTVSYSESPTNIVGVTKMSIESIIILFTLLYIVVNICMFTVVMFVSMDTKRRLVCRDTLFIF